MVALLALFSVGGVNAQSPDGLDCPNSELLDRYRAAAYMANVFDTTEWTPTIAQVADNSYFVSYFPDFADAAVALTYYPFPCGYTEENIEAFSVEATYDMVFQYYSGWERTDQCAAGDVTLEEFILIFEGRPYASRFWIHRYTDNRVVTVNLVFSESRVSDLDGYSEALFPDLSSCDPNFRDERPPLEP